MKCNICGGKISVNWEFLHRELPSCPRCKSTVRQREIVFELNEIITRYFAKSTLIDVVGLSDHENISAVLHNMTKISYRNTFIDSNDSLRLDIVNPSTEFLSSADLFDK